MIIKPIPSEPGYFASDDGRIFSSKRGGLKERSYVPNPNTGLLAVMCYQGNKGFTKQVSRLVAETFLDDWDKSKQVDHISGDRSDNSVQNLRMLSVGDNCRAFQRPRNGVSRYRGVSWSERIGKWVATIGLNGKTKHIGVFSTEVEAAAAYNSYASEIGYFPEAFNSFIDQQRENAQIGRLGTKPGNVPQQ